MILLYTLCIYIILISCLWYFFFTFFHIVLLTVSGHVHGDNLYKIYDDVSLSSPTRRYFSIYALFIPRNQCLINLQVMSLLFQLLRCCERPSLVPIELVITWWRYIVFCFYLITRTYVQSTLRNIILSI